MAPSATTPNLDAVDGGCARCGASNAQFEARQDMVCQDCFVRFIETKIIKRMESTDFRVRHSTKGMTRKLLLPISGGVSSASLLKVINRSLEGQISRMGRTGFALIVLFVDDGKHEEQEVSAFMAGLKERYPRHEYKTVPLMADVEQEHGEDDGLGSMDVNDLLKSLSSPTSQSDIASIALTHTIIRQAQMYKCEGIIWGDTTTRLAEKILASTALGRGATLPWLVNDGSSPYTLSNSSTKIVFLYPMKDVLRKELEPYSKVSNITTLAMPQRASGAVVSSKNATIDGLMKEYFESVEKDYPSIVANVVRTSSKLRPTNDVTTHLKQDESAYGASHCELCGVPVAAGAFGIYSWGGSQASQNAGTVNTSTPSQPVIPIDPTVISDHRLCYGCARSTLPV